MKKNNIFSYINLFILLSISLVVIIPFLNILAKSLTSSDSMHLLNGFSILPKNITLLNYKIIFSNPQILQSLFNSFFITIVGTFLNLTFTITAAYVLTRKNLVFKNFFMIILIITMVFEPGIIQEYLLMKNLNLLNTYTSLFLYKTVDVFYLIILMRFFENIPEDIIEAAYLDGANHFNILTKIILPLSKQILASMTLFYAVFRWNEYFRATIFLSSSNKWPLQLLLRQFIVLNDNSSLLSNTGNIPIEFIKSVNFESIQASVIVISIIPLFIIYPFILKYYTKGTMEGAVK